MDTQIRDMTEPDIAATVAIIAVTSRFDGRLAERYYRGYFGDADRVAGRGEQNYVAVARESGEICGVCGYSPDKYNLPDIRWLNWFYVAPPHRRQGIGTQLMQYTLDALRDAKIRQIYLDTGSSSIYAAATRLYRHFGFQSQGRLIAYYKNEDYVIMGRDVVT